MMGPGKAGESLLLGIGYFLITENEGIRLILQDNSDGIHPVVFSGGKLRRFCFSGVPFFYCGNWFGQGPGVNS